MLFLRTFGGLSIENGGRLQTGAAAQRRPLAVLAVIAAAGDKGVSREMLQSFFWPDSDPERARGSLKQTLYAFRRDVNEQGVTLGNADLRLNTEVISSDVGEFRSAIGANEREKAVNLYSGRFLEGIFIRNLDEFGRWVELERESLSRDYRVTLEALASEATATGNHQLSASWWARLVADDPYASRAALGYIKALAASGEREAAIRHASIHSQLVREELEAEPDPAIENAVAEIRAPRQSPPLTRYAEKRTASDAGALTTASHYDGSNRTNADEQTGFSSESAVSSAPTRMRWVLAAVLGAGIAVVLTASVLRTRATRSTAADQPSRLVVVPFENRTGDVTLDALGSMGADWITDGLARAELIPVADPATAAAAVQSIKDKSLADQATLKRIATLTGATRVVSGSFYRRSDSLEFHARVSDPQTGNILGAIEPVVVALTDAERGVDSLRHHTLSLLAKLIDARLAQVTMASSKPPSFAAYKEFVTGVDLQSRRAIAESDAGDSASLQARVHFRKAYALDTTFVSALVWALFTVTPDEWPTEGQPLFDSLSLRRKMLAPLDRHAIEYFDAMLKSDKTNAIRAARAAADLAPRSEWSWIAGQALFPLNRPRETLNYFERLDPDNGWMRQGWEYYWYLTAQAKHMVGDLPGTHRWLRRARIKFPSNSPIAAAYARSLALTGKSDSVATVVREILESDVEWKMFYVYSILEDLRRHGQKQDVAAVYRQARSWYDARGSAANEVDRREFGRIYFSMNMYGPAREQFARMVRDFPESTWKTFYTGHLAVVNAILGDTTIAKELIASVPKSIQQWDGENFYWRARVAAQLGQKEDAVRLLHAAFDEGYPQVSLSHSTWYDFARLQGYPPFEALVASDR